MTTLNELAASEEDGPFMYGLLREYLDVEVVARFTIDGEPASKSRARWSPKTGRHYTPEGTRIAEQRVGWAFRQATTGYVRNSTDGYGVLAGFFCGTGQRRDVDNMLKLILDGLNKIAWDDDSQVTEISGRLQRYVSDPRTEVVVYRSPLAVRQPTKHCEQCGKEFRAYPSQNGGSRKRRFCSQECFYAKVRAANKRTCLHCGKDFQSKGDAKYCGRTCAYTAKHAKLTCTHCGIEFTRAQSLTRRTKNPMCSDECRVAYWREQRSAAAKGICGSCGGPTSKKTYRRCNACRIGGLTIHITEETSK